MSKNNLSESRDCTVHSWLSTKRAYPATRVVLIYRCLSTNFRSKNNLNLINLKANPKNRVTQKRKKICTYDHAFYH